MGLTFKTPNGGRSAMAEANNNRGRFRTYSAPTPKKKAPAPTPRHRDAYVAPKAKKPSASPIKSTANTTPLAPAKITQGVDERPNGSFKGGLVSNAIAKAKPVASINYNTDDATETTNSKQSTASITAIKPAAPKPSLLLDKTKPVEPSLVDSPKPEKAEEKGFFSSLKDAAGLLFDDPRTKESGRYNQKYWAERLAAGKAAGNTNIQAELAAEQAGQGGASKSYSQEKVPGYFEPLDHPSQKKIATLPKTQDVQNEIKALDNQIANETDPVKLKAAHQRRLMLMRRNNTNTKFAGLLDDADTKRSNLMSIR